MSSGLARMIHLFRALTSGQPNIPIWAGFHWLFVAGYIILFGLTLAWMIYRVQKLHPSPIGVRWLSLLLLLGLMHGLVYSVINPPWFAPDEPSHFEYARLFADLGRVPRSDDVSEALQGEIIESMCASDFWRLNNMVTPDEPPIAFGTGLTGDWKKIPPTFVVDKRLIWYVPQVGNEPPLYYAFVRPAFWAIWGRGDILRQLYWMRWLTLSFYLFCIAVAFWTAREYFTEFPESALGITALVIFQPMFSYMAAAANNDLAGAAVGAAWFGLAIMILSRGWTWPRGIGLISLALLGTWAKKTDFFLYPLFGIVVGLYYFRSQRRRFFWKGSLAIVGGVVVILGILVLGRSEEQAAMWVVRPNPQWSVRTRQFAFEGEHAFHLRTQEANENMRLNQLLSPIDLSLLRGQTVVLQAMVRGKSPEQYGQLGFIDDKGWHMQRFVVGEEWQSVSLKYEISESTQFLRVSLQAGDETDTRKGEIFYDAVSLRSVSGSLKDREFLQNGSAEQSTTLLRVFLFRVAQQFGFTSYIIPWFAQPNTEKWVVLLPKAIQFAFETFWGRFGSLNVVMPSMWNKIWIGMTGLAVTGVVKYWMDADLRNQKKSLCTFFLLISIILAWIQILLPLVHRPGPHWIPQGRFLFPIVVPMALLIYLGLLQFVPQRWQKWLPVTLFVFTATMDTTALLTLLRFRYG